MIHFDGICVGNHTICAKVSNFLSWFLCTYICSSFCLSECLNKMLRWVFNSGWGEAVSYSKENYTSEVWCQSKLHDWPNSCFFSEYLSLLVPLAATRVFCCIKCLQEKARFRTIYCWVALEKVRLFVPSLFYNYLFVKEENTIHVAARHSPLGWWWWYNYGASLGWHRSTS